MAIIPNFQAGFRLIDGTDLNQLVSWLNQFRGAAVAYADRPTSPYKGQVQWFSDSNTATFGATIAAGGVNVVLGMFCGTNWTVVAVGP